MHACIFENGKFKINKGFGGDRKDGNDRNDRKEVVWNDRKGNGGIGREWCGGIGKNMDILTFVGTRSS